MPCPLGIFMGLNPYVRAIVKPVFDLLKPMPPISWISLSILWFGLGEESKVFIIAIGSFVPCILNSYNGIRLIDPALYDAAGCSGPAEGRKSWKSGFFASAPAIFAGLQISLSIAWSCVLAAELVGSQVRDGIHHHSGHESVVAGIDHRRHGGHRHNRLPDQRSHGSPGKYGSAHGRGNCRNEKRTGKNRIPETSARPSSKKRRSSVHVLDDISLPFMKTSSWSS